MKKGTVLITGGAGFIGSHTADILAKKGYTIRILDNLLQPVHTKNWPTYITGKGYELIKGDVRKKDDWFEALRGVEYVFHLAAYQDQKLDFSTFFETNTTSTALLYECIVEKNLPVKKVVVASSQFVYGDGQYKCNHSGKKEIFYAQLRTLKQFEKKQWDIMCPHGKNAEHIPFKEGQMIYPTNAYGLSKKALEEVGMRLGKTYGIPTVALRYSIVQGSRQSPRNLYSGALRIFVSQALAGLPLTVYEDGKCKRDFVNIADVVAANILVLENKKADFEVFNVGSGQKYSVIEFAREVIKITKSNSLMSINGFRRTDTRNAISNITKLKNLGWKPKHTITDSIESYVEWFKKEGFDKVVDKKQLYQLKDGIRK
jgi:dTDP-L-rhamnose 4-epimerase